MVMTKPALQKIYVIFDAQDKGQLGVLSQTLTGLFSYVNLTSNLCLVTGDLPEGMPMVEGIQKAVSGFLRENLFARLYLHFVHRAAVTSVSEVDFCYQYYYQPLKMMTRQLDQEGYMHQEIPRFMLLPVIVPDSPDEASSLTRLLEVLKSAFLLPCLFLNKDTGTLAQDEALMARAEKVYYGHSNSRETAEIVCNLFHQDILEDSLAKLESETISMTDPCPAALIISAQDGLAYACIDAFVKKESLADIYGNLDVDSLMARYYEHGTSKRDCLACRQRVAESCADMSLPKAMTHEIGALLYHFGTLHQAAEDHVQAAENYKKSLNLSPVEEAGPICLRLGLSFTKTGRYDQAFEAFEKAEPTCDDQYYFHFYVGFCYFEKGDYVAALEKFSKALGMGPQHDDLVRILIYMGTCYNSLGRYEEAVIELEKATQAAGHVKEVYSALGFSCFQLKDYDKAIDNLNKAVELDPYSAVDYASLGANYREKGDITMAIAMYQKALELDPSFAGAKQNVDRLKKKL